MPPALRLRSDEHLVRLFRAGREDAFEALHDRHRRRLHAVAARALRTAGGDAEGVVQEAFLRAHRSLRDSDRPVELKPWLHRVVRNLCIDELRRTRSTVELHEDGASEDIYATLSRRHELRGLIEDLADLPEQQRAALLMRELDGLSHEQVAGVLEISPAASRQLVKRARNGLVAAAQARDAACAGIREDLLTAHDEKRRPSEHALRHLKRCSACREFRDELKSTRTRLRALVPTIGLGPLGGLLGGGGGVATKVIAGACCAVLAAGGATAWVAGQHKTIRGTSPATEGGGKALIGKPIRSGTKLPSSVAIATLTVKLQPGVRAVARVSCPAGMGAAGLAQPRAQDGSVALGSFAAYQYSDRDVHALAHGGRHTATIIYKPDRGLKTPAVVRIGTLCKRR